MLYSTNIQALYLYIFSEELFTFLCKLLCNFQFLFYIHEKAFSVLLGYYISTTVYYNHCDTTYCLIPVSYTHLKIFWPSCLAMADFLDWPRWQTQASVNTSATLFKHSNNFWNPFLHLIQYTTFHLFNSYKKLKSVTPIFLL